MTENELLKTLIT